MNHSRAFLISLFTALLALSLQAAEIRQLTGKAAVRRNGSKTWFKAEARTKINDGDTVRTAAGSRADIGLAAGHRLAMREKTILRLDSSDPKDTRFSLLLGRVRSFITKLKKGNKFEMKTPVAVASVRGTIFEVEVGADRSSRLSVIEGSVGYKDLAGLGQEAMVLQGQSVLAEPNGTFRPPEPLPLEMNEGLKPGGDQKESAKAPFKEETAASGAEDERSDELKYEIQKETAFDSMRDGFQTDAVQETRNAQYQEGKTMIDAFGRRVRLEEYLTRPNDKEFSIITLNFREERFDFSRFDVYAKNPLPVDLSSLNLFYQNGQTPMGNWAEKMQKIVSNGDNYVREWKDGGVAKNMNPDGSASPNGDEFQQVVYADWFVEAKGDNGPVLLSHWKPTTALIAGNPAGGQTVETDGVQDVPLGYKNFDKRGDAAIGDDRAIDNAIYDGRRLDYFTDSTVAGQYLISEGYNRTAKATWDGKFNSDIMAMFPSDAQRQQEFKYNARLYTEYSQYNDEAGSPIIQMQRDEYRVTDSGRLLSPFEVSSSGFLGDVNFENVFHSSLFGNRSIDVVFSPVIFDKSDTAVP